MDAKWRAAPSNPNPRRSTAPVAGVLDQAPDHQSAGKQAMLQAFHFLRALSRIRGVTGGRVRSIRRAAYSSMALARAASSSSPRRVWSQALLRQARARRSTRRTVMVRRRVVAGAAPAPAPPLPGRAHRRSGRSAPAGETSSAAAARALIPPPRQAGEPPRTDALRRLVPGGAGMEYCSLLEETADYLRCLRAQVQIMQGLADLFSCQ